jgi:isocitrate lyase
MIDEGRRGFFKRIIMAGAVLAVPGEALLPRKTMASAAVAIEGVCLLVPNLEMGAEFAEQMKKSAPGSWRVHTLKGSLTDFYLETRGLYEEAQGQANTFVGVADPAAFTVIHEAIGDCGGRFHFITYESRHRVNFSVQV